MKISIFFILFIILAICISAQTTTFNINFNTNLGTFKTFDGVNSKFLNSTDSGYHDIKIKEIRTHAFSEADYWFYTNGFVNLTTHYADTATYNSSFNPQLQSSYNFSSGVDSLISNLINNGYIPYFRLGVGWPNFADTICFPCIPLSPPADNGDTTFHTFAAICKKTVEHFTKGWGADTGYFYNIPEWEVWNEPDGVFWKGNELQFYKLYQEVTDSIKSIDTTIKVGTCGLTKNGIINQDTLYFKSLLKYCKNNSVPVDFYSWHLYKRYNPYSVKSSANYVRTTLNSEGFFNTKSHISEINAELDGTSVYDTSAKGSAYVASLLMTCQESPVDKLFWFAGNGLGPLANPDISGVADLTWKGVGMKSHNTLVFETPVKLYTTGNLVVPNLPVDTTNVMIIAGKDSIKNQADILISNLNSNFTNFIVTINNLPFTAPENILIEQYKTQDSNSKYELTTDTVSGSPIITITINSATAPSVYLLKISKLNNSEINETSEKNKIKYFPNPVNETIYFSEPLNNIKIYNVYGQIVLSNIKTANKIIVEKLSDGLYFAKSDNYNFKFIVKH